MAEWLERETQNLSIGGLFLFVLIVLSRAAF